MAKKHEAEQRHQSLQEKHKGLHEEWQTKLKNALSEADTQHQAAIDSLREQYEARVESLQVSLRFKGLFLYTVDILFLGECCIIRQPWCSTITLYKITSIVNNHHTDIYPY